MLIIYRYQYHPPKYDRGPLHPVQSPPSSDPVARNFVPGPFNLPRIKQTWESMIAPDLMTLAYQHTPPGTPAPPIKERLRSWDDSSPYHKNRPLRGPRGGSTLRLLEHEITWRNIPKITAVSINMFVPKAYGDKDWLNVARSILQSISGSSPETTVMKHGVSQWKVQKGGKIGAKTTIYGDQAHEFVDKLVNLVLPKIKDWPGIQGMLQNR
jgi:large subunit ribosomal protein L5